ncbi:MAG: hypothetical protein K9K66_04110 [Desulfarculaceae bacterium]|nr:hypothetical protein [Desulfarculaceae bacterium]MCF8073226.1 hypothetical protein [Desulfarculaceae bacterium]MCF8100822.1 hypothetical protein [Desulfarculaceae bacterium]MCF8117740.1 hypothetical protein [Desulfarculaceae bacterium]
MGRIEPIFNLSTPILFAHRGGVLEAPESTAMAFDHALNVARAEVLELDVHLTLDGQFVVWHGPKLSNVLIEGQPTRPKERERNKIYDYSWDELEGKAWVGDPVLKEMDEDDIDLSGVPREQRRQLLPLARFLALYPEAPLNIEMKSSFKRKLDDHGRKGLKDNLRAFISLLDQGRGQRTIVVVSASDSIIDAFRELAGESYPTGLSALEQVALLTIGRDMRGRALETSYSEMLSPRGLIRRVAEDGGSTFVFLTAFSFLLPAIDAQAPPEQDIFAILDRGVDGIMTDRPAAVRQIMDRWKQAHP